jgi:hypothetical protein
VRFDVETNLAKLRYFGWDGSLQRRVKWSSQRVGGCRSPLSLHLSLSLSLSLHLSHTLYWILWPWGQPTEAVTWAAAASTKQQTFSRMRRAAVYVSIKE